VAGRRAWPAQQALPFPGVRRCSRQAVGVEVPPGPVSDRDRTGITLPFRACGVTQQAGGGGGAAPAGRGTEKGEGTASLPVGTSKCQSTTSSQWDAVPG